MSDDVKTLTLYPNLRLELNGSECTVNYYYYNLEMTDIDKDKIKIEKFAPPQINSKESLYNFLNFLNKNSREQQFKITRKGMFGLLKKLVVIPRISVTSNYSSDTNSKELEKLKVFFDDYDPLHEWQKLHGIESEDNQVYERLNFDDGAKILLFTYKAEPSYSTRWEYETKDGGPDSRYKNNRSWNELSHYTLKLMIPGRLYSSDYVSEYDYESFIEDVKKINSSVSFDHIKLGSDITSSETNMLLIKMQQENKKEMKTQKSNNEHENLRINQMNFGGSAKTGSSSGCFTKIIFLILIVLGFRYYINKPKKNYTGYAVAQIPLNEYTAIESAPMNKEIGIIKIDTVLKVIETSKKGELTWIKAYKLNSDDTVKETFVCLPEKVNIQSKNKYVLYNQNSRSWKAYYERVDKRNQPIYEKYKKDFIEATKSIEVKKGSDNIVKESVKDSCWILEQKGYFDLYVANGNVFYYINKSEKDRFLNAYRKFSEAYELNKVKYFPK